MMSKMGKDIQSFFYSTYLHFYWEIMYITVYTFLSIEILEPVILLHPDSLWATVL